jgi:NAD(P)-dependent dehydrogenase (short-subunit alcohol dehydrogenase family)
MLGRLEGMVAVITGSGGAGLGRAGAKLFAAEGAKIVVLDVRSQGIEETLKQIHDDGGKAVGIETDVTVLSDVERMFDFALSEFGQVDILWNNAAILMNMFTPGEEITAEEWDRTFAVIARGTFFCTRTVVPHMKARLSGAIVNTASGAAISVKTPGFLHYAASKAAVVQMTKWLAAELGPFNIRVNSLVGGGIRGPGGVWAQDEFKMPDVSPWGGLPVRIPEVMPDTDATRWPTPVEFARGALYLVDPASGPVTGVILPVDGGRASRGF